jgi:hypothetical protein
MFQGECRKVGVWNVIRAESGNCQEFRQHFSVSNRGKRYPGRPTIQPGLGLLPGDGETRRALEYARIRHQTNEAKNTCPRKADTRRVGQARIKPIPGCSVLRERVYIGVDKQVCIHKNHR